ncbi:MAG: hypothetical protein GEU89_10400 [Kiloniellaceae bacterium]|nr:hypothetical protein [Kiloniellaceae bacterium]
MEPDRRNLLQYFDDPPATRGGLVGGLVILFLLLAAITSWEILVPTLQAVSDAIVAWGVGADGP